MHLSMLVATGGILLLPMVSAYNVAQLFLARKGAGQQVGKAQPAQQRAKPQNHDHNLLTPSSNQGRHPVTPTASREHVLGGQSLQNTLAVAWDLGMHRHHRWYPVPAVTKAPRRSPNANRIGK